METETINQKAIIYDDNCPMCSLYTQGFVYWGLLEPQNRIPFSRIEATGLLNQLDADKARHEIPLVDLAGGKTLYGPEALVFLLKQKVPVLNNLWQWRGARTFIHGLYQLISYNRRVIIPAGQVPGAFNCAPDFNRKYRLRFIYLGIFMTCLLTYGFGASLENSLKIIHGGLSLLLIVSTGWAIQFLLAGVFLKLKRLEYIGQLALIMLMGVFLLVPGILISTFWPSPWVPLISVLLSSSLMVQQHIFRLRHLQISPRWTWLWFVNLLGTVAAWVFFFLLN